MSPVAWSNEKRQGLRRPLDQISSRPALATYGLLEGIRYRWWELPPLTLIRRILPRRLSTFCARFPGSPLLPPSPSPMYRYLSGPKVIIPPLWFAYGWGTVRIGYALDRTATFPFVDERRYRAITVSPFERV